MGFVDIQRSSEENNQNISVNIQKYICVLKTA